MHPLLKSKGKKPRTGTVKRCRQCEKDFYRSPSGSMQPYCSFACHKEWLKNNSTKTTKTCKQCKDKYSTYRSQIKHRGSNFCSTVCMRRWRTEQAATPGARSQRRQMRGGKMRSIDNMFSRVIRARDRICQHCGTDKSLQCSHVLPRTYLSVRWNTDNAIALCYRCHIYWWHKYPHDASQWFDSRWPGRYQALRELSDRHIKLDREAEMAKLHALLLTLTK